MFKLISSAMLECSPLLARSMNAHYGPDSDERSQHLSQNGAPYWVGSTHWQHYLSSATLCQDCTPYFVKYNWLRAKTFIPAHTGRQLVLNLAKNETITPGTTASLLDDKTLGGQQFDRQVNDSFLSGGTDTHLMTQPVTLWTGSDMGHSGSNMEPVTGAWLDHHLGIPEKGAEVCRAASVDAQEEAFVPPW
jgi:hypothetical protein